MPPETDLCGIVQLSDDSRTGQVMCKLAHHWGFDGVATYNLIPLLGSKSDKAVAQAMRCKDQSPDEWQAKVSRNNGLISNDLIGSDAVLLGWGSKGAKPFVRELATTLIHGLDRKSTWAFDVNQNGRVATPRHAAIRGAFSLEDCRPQPFARSLVVLPPSVHDLPTSAGHIAGR